MNEIKYVIYYSDDLEAWVGELWSVDDDGMCRVQRVSDASADNVFNKLELLVR